MKRRPRRSPFGWALAALRKRPDRARNIAFRLLGRELGGRVWKAARVAALREGDPLLQGERTHEGRRARFVSTAVRVLEHTEPSRARALSSKLWQGRLAIAEGISLRQLQRYLRALRRSGALRMHQPPADRVPERLRGAHWAYAVWDWTSHLPVETHATLARWRLRAASSGAPPPPS